MEKLELTFLGAAGTVTGSRHLLSSAGRDILLDCGMFQGRRDIRTRNWSGFGIDPARIDALALSHAHLDHSGYIPRLIKDGYRGPVLCTPPTLDLCEILLTDSGYLQERDAEYANRKRFSRHDPALPLYTEEDAKAAMEQFDSVEFGESVEPVPGARLVFRRAGHILGAATVTLDWQGRRIVFSGDLGREDDPLLPDPDPVGRADFLLLETTYGDRLHERRDVADLLHDVIERTVRRGGTVIIPAFAVGRAQLLTWHLWRLKCAGRLDSIPVYLDSPMAIDASILLNRHVGEHKLSAADARAMGRMIEYVRDTERSKELTADPMPKIIIAASGMVTGGRVQHHLKAYAPHRRNTILFSGFQAPGTPGAAILAGADEIRLHGRTVPIEAEVADLPMLSAHADADGLMSWLRRFEQPPRRTFLVHGEPQASRALRDRIEHELGWDCHIPEHGERVAL